ncbi:MAG TPA: hypothetical protein PJ986_14735 [Gammaproteobacteria bacterium]|nr:hypothetical protein [Gammaproteobacteria bacterium]
MGRRREKDQHLPPRMLLREKVYYYKAPGIYRRLSANWDEAYALYQELGGPVNEAHTVGPALDHYLQTDLNSKAESTRREYTRYARAIRTAFGDQRLEALTSSDVAQYLRRRSAKVEANREMTMLSSIYSEAMAQGWCDVNPCRGVRRNPEKPATIIPSATEIQKLKLAAAAQMRCMLEMELAAGARKDDLLAIRLADWSDAGLLIVQSKTGNQCSTNARLNWKPSGSGAARCAVASAASICSPAAWVSATARRASTPTGSGCGRRPGSEPRSPSTA